MQCRRGSDGVAGLMVDVTHAAGSGATIAAAFGLGSGWEPILDRLTADIDDLNPWLHRFVAATEPVTDSDIQIVTLRMSGLGTREIAEQVGRPNVRRAHVEHLCLAVAVRLAADAGDRNWRLSLTDGTGRRLVREGVPPYASDVRLHEEFTSMWLDGEPLADIRTRLSLSGKAAQRRAETATPRWYGRQVASHLGWSRENHRRRLATGHFPTPDGRDGYSNWWWPDTITAWAKEQRLQRCPECGAKVLKLPQHVKAHTRTA